MLDFLRSKILSEFFPDWDQFDKLKEYYLQAFVAAHICPPYVHLFLRKVCISK